MTAPYAPGEAVVWLNPTEHGLSAHQTFVLEIRPEGENWRVMTSHGAELVGPDGSGARVLPMDPELSEEFAKWGDGFSVLPTIPEREREAERGKDIDGQEREL
jgi:hypothetical protein